VSAEYTFGDSERAARRLELVARVFEAGSAAFLRAHGRRDRELALDLGCGPGHTTELLLRTLAPVRTLGIEASAEFGALAAQRLHGRAGVVIADVRTLPEQLSGADLIYARLLLTHLAQPLAAVAVWRTRLAPTGVVLLEEVEAIETDDPVLADYLALQRAMLAGRGHALEIGPRLHAALGAEPGVVSELGICRPALRDAAAMFALNLPSWRHRPEVAARRSSAQLDALAAALEDRAGAGEDDPAGPAITWRMRRLVLPPAV
jgi:trans-aconitate 2-methyltransferase